MLDQDGPPQGILDLVDILRRAYPDSISEYELPSLMSVLRDRDMSYRSIALAIGLYHGETYLSFLYQAQVCEVDESVTDELKFAVVEHLRKLGFDAWEASLD